MALAPCLTEVQAVRILATWNASLERTHWMRQFEQQFPGADDAAWAAHGKAYAEQQWEAEKTAAYGATGTSNVGRRIALSVAGLLRCFLTQQLQTFWHYMAEALRRIHRPPLVFGFLGLHAEHAKREARQVKDAFLKLRIDHYTILADDVTDEAARRAVHDYYMRREWKLPKWPTRRAAVTFDLMRQHEVRSSETFTHVLALRQRDIPAGEW